MSPAELEEGMLVERDVVDAEGLVLVPRWIRITGPLLSRLGARSWKAGLRTRRCLSLVADGEAAARSLLRQRLLGFGPCDETATCEEAVAAFRREFELGRPHDVAFIDLSLPDAGGLRVVREIRRLESGIAPRRRERTAVILTTAAADRGVIARAFVDGCDACLDRPVRTDRLLAHMRLLGLCG